MKKIIILMGVPGSGKGTQAVGISHDFNYGHVSTGNLLRKLQADPEVSKEDREMLEQMKNGELVSDELIYKLAFKEIDKYFSENKGVILDGAIRSVEQAKKYQDFFEKKNLGNEIVAIDIDISDEKSLERLVYRRDTSKDIREDDNLEIIKKRIEEQGNNAILPILQYYKSLGILEVVNGEGSIEEVNKNIINILNYK